MTDPADSPAPPGRLRALLPARLPDWRRGETLDLGTEPPAGPADTPDPDTAPDIDAAPDTDAAPDPDPGPGNDPGPEPKTRTTPGMLPPGIRETPTRITARARAWRTGLHPKTAWLAYNGSAAAAGYATGLAPALHGWIAGCGQDASIGAALVLGTGILAATAQLIDRRTRTWWPPLAWAARIPLASSTLALALYTPAATL